MPSSGIKLMDHDDILTFGEICEVVALGGKMGISKIRITGGEPLVRKGIVELISMISKIPTVKDLSMTTNGVLLERFAKSLKMAGLQRLNISLDTVDAAKFKNLTRVGKLQDTMNGIKAAQNAGFETIKINCVIKSSPLEPDAWAVTNFCLLNDLQFRYIKEMDLEKGYFSKVIGGEGGNCQNCNRLRLTADGKIKPCLFSNINYDIRQFGIEKALRFAVSNKPVSGKSNTENIFSNIGG